MSQAPFKAQVETRLNPFMDGSFSEWLACAESAPHLPSYLTAGAEQWNWAGPSLAARVVLSFGAAMFAVPLSPWRRSGQTLRDTARFTPSSDTFLPCPLTRCIWGGAELFVGVVPKLVSMPKSGEGLCPFEPCSKGGTSPFRNPPVPHCFSGHFFQQLLLSVHGRDGLSQPFPHSVRGSNEVGGAWRA